MISMFKRLIDKNFRKPGGLIGLYIIRFLKKNQVEYDEMEPLIDLKKGDTVLEIGYGLGKGIYDFAGKNDSTFHGIDFSKLMYSKACKLNHEYVKSGRVILQCADFDTFSYESDTFNCVYFLNVIYFWDEIQSRLKKIYSILKPYGKVIIFMADADRFKDVKMSEGKSIFRLYGITEVIGEMEKTGFKTIETKEHSKEEKCYYITGYKI